MHRIGFLFKERRPEAAYGHLLPQGEKKGSTFSEEGVRGQRKYFVIAGHRFQWTGSAFRRSSMAAGEKERYWLCVEKWPQLRGHSPLVVPVMVTLDDYRSVAVMVVPATMQPTVMLVELGARPAVVITIAVVIISVAADPEAETLSACHSRRRNCDGG